MKKPANLTPRGMSSHPRQGRTLGDLAREKMALVAVCRRCTHRRVLYPRNLLEQFGEHCPAIALRQRLRCSVCRCRSGNLHESAR